VLPTGIERVDATLEQRPHLKVPLSSIRKADPRELADRDLSAASAKSVLAAPSLQSCGADLDEQAPPPSVRRWSRERGLALLIRVGVREWLQSLMQGLTRAVGGPSK